MVNRIKANHEIIRQNRCTVLIYLDWLIEWSTWLIACDLLVGWDTKCVTYLQTELEMAVNAWVAFATKNLSVCWPVLFVRLACVLWCVVAVWLSHNTWLGYACHHHNQHRMSSSPATQSGFRDSNITSRGRNLTTNQQYILYNIYYILYIFSIRNPRE